MELARLKELLRENGVVGAGGAGFPTYAKLTDKADTVILNCAECEPLLKLHRQVLELYAEEILSAFTEVLNATGAGRGIVAVKAHYTKTVEALESVIGGYPELRIFRLESVYPAGDEIILIKTVTGRTVNPGELPASVGVTVINVETMYNIWRSLNGNPVTDKFVTVAGEVKNPLTVCVPIGTKLKELIEFAGGLTSDNCAFINGGPMMGKTVNLNETVTKTTNAVLALPENSPAVTSKRVSPKISLLRAMSVCCQCHTCTDLCSRHVAGYPVEPHMVMRVLSNGGKGDIQSIAGSMYCSGCGLCQNYSCPQGLSPKTLIDEIKAEAKRNGIKPVKGLKALEHTENEEYRKVSVERLTMRLGINKYDTEAPVTGGFETGAVKISLLQHIGVPAKACVTAGEAVKKGQVIAKAAEGALSVNIHASIDGKITEMNDKYIVINRT